MIVILSPLHGTTNYLKKHIEVKVKPNTNTDPDNNVLYRSHLFPARFLQYIRGSFSLGVGSIYIQYHMQNNIQG